MCQYVVLWLMLMSLSLDCVAYVDYCTSDPRIERDKSDCFGEKAILYVTGIEGNINHALHDFLWAITVYLTHCSGKISTIVMTGEKINSEDCLKPDKHGTDSKSSPVWGQCVLFILSGKHGIPIHFEENGADKSKIPGNSTCNSRIWFGSTPKGYGSDGFNVRTNNFRNIDYLVRKCTPGIPCNRTAAMHIADEAAADAFQTIRKESLRYLSVQPRDGNTPVHVLVYDRMDAHRRQWMNSGSLIHRLKRQRDVSVHNISSIPDSFSDQVKLFAWADIAIMPHGAALANSVFMAEGTDIIEIRKACDETDGKDRFRLQDWTGWHSRFIGLHIAYAKCQYKEKNLNHGQTVNERVSNGGPIYVSPEELISLLNFSIHRQLIRLQEIQGTYVRSLITSRMQHRDLISNLKFASVFAAGSSISFCWLLLIFKYRKTVVYFAK